MQKKLRAKLSSTLARRLGAPQARLKKCTTKRTFARHEPITGQFRGKIGTVLARLPVPMLFSGTALTG